MRIPSPLVIALLFGVCLGSCKGEIFSASSNMMELFNIEEKMVDILEDFLTKMKGKLNRIERYIEEFHQVKQENADTPQKFVERVAGNPIHAFHIIKRFIIDWKHINREMNEDDWTHIAKKINRIGKTSKIPVEDDMHGAAVALVRLQDVYNMNTTELANGIFLGIQTPAKLTAQDCLYMGKHSFNQGTYSRAIEWFEESFKLAGQENNQTLTQDQALQFLDHAITVHDQMLAQKHELEGTEYEYRESARVKSPAVQRQEQMKARKYQLGLNTTSTDIKRNYNALCRGEKLMEPKLEAKMKCWYESRTDKYWIIQPIKVERNYFDPPLFTLHDVIRDANIQNIISLSYPLLSRGMVQEQDGVGRQKTGLRVCQTAWLGDAFEPSIMENSQRISWLTGLKTDGETFSAEPLQVANYGMGGHYEPHFDSLLSHKSLETIQKMDPYDVAAGDRIATFMYYLSDVEKGGATVFPKIGVSVWPEKGSAAFWYNLKGNGETHELTIHGGCPVVRGHKWVGNKWIRSRNQAFTKRCPPNGNE